MNFLTDFEWPMAFIAVYLFFFVIVMIKSDREWRVLGSEVQRNAHDSQKCFELMDRYLKSNPFSQMNSTLRLMTIPALLHLNKEEKLRIYIKKIRAVDILPSAVDYLVLALFWLREYGYQSEYELLKAKCEKGYKACRIELFQALMQETVDIAVLPRTEELSQEDFRFTRAVIAYYRCLDFLNKDDKENAEAQFIIAQQVMPNVKNFLKKKGYEL